MSPLARTRVRRLSHEPDDPLVVLLRDLVQVALESEAPVVAPTLRGRKARRDLAHVRVLVRLQYGVRLSLHPKGIVLARLLLALEHLRVVLEILGGHFRYSTELHDLRQIEDQLIARPHPRDLAASRALEPENIEPARFRDPHVLLRPNDDPVSHATSSCAATSLPQPVKPEGPDALSHRGPYSRLVQCLAASGCKPSLARRPQPSGTTCRRRRT